MFRQEEFLLESQNLVLYSDLTEGMLLVCMFESLSNPYKSRNQFALLKKLFATLRTPDMLKRRQLEYELSVQDVLNGMRGHERLAHPRMTEFFPYTNVDYEKNLRSVFRIPNNEAIIGPPTPPNIKGAIELKAEEKLLIDPLQDEKQDVLKEIALVAQRSKALLEPGKNPCVLGCSYRRIESIVARGERKNSAFTSIVGNSLEKESAFAEQAFSPVRGSPMRSMTVVAKKPAASPRASENIGY